MQEETPKDHDDRPRPMRVAGTAGLFDLADAPEKSMTPPDDLSDSRGELNIPLIAAVGVVVLALVLIAVLVLL